MRLSSGSKSLTWEPSFGGLEGNLGLVNNVKVKLSGLSLIVVRPTVSDPGSVSVERERFDSRREREPSLERASVRRQTEVDPMSSDEVFRNCSGRYTVFADNRDHGDMSSPKFCAIFDTLFRFNEETNGSRVARARRQSPWSTAFMSARSSESSPISLSLDSWW